MTTDPTNLDLTTVHEPVDPQPSRSRRRSRSLVAGAAALVVAVALAALALGGGDADRLDATGADLADEVTTTTEADEGTTTSTTEADDEAAVLGTGAGAPSAGSGGGGTAPAPKVGLLSFSTTVVDLGPTVDQGKVSLRNDGTGTAQWQISQALPAWIDLAPTSGSLAPGAIVELTFTADRSGLGNGTQQADLAFSADAGFAGPAHVAVSVAVEKAEITQLVGAPGVICALQSPGAGPKVASIVVAGQHMSKADLVWAKIGAPGADLQKSLTYDEANDRWVTTYSSKVPGVHHLSAYATGSNAVPGDAGAGAITVIWCN